MAHQLISANHPPSHAPGEFSGGIRHQWLNDGQELGEQLGPLLHGVPPHQVPDPWTAWGHSHGAVLRLGITLERGNAWSHP